MKKLTISSFTLLVLGFAPVAFAQTNVTSGHWDIAAHEHDGLLELSLHNHDLEIEEPLQGSTITYNFGTNAKVDVTIGASNLGLLWVSPASEEDADTAGMPFIGFSAEELAPPFTGPVTSASVSFSRARSCGLISTPVTLGLPAMKRAAYRCRSAGVGRAMLSTYPMK